ncbi:2'-5' RNA ligase family protein [Candidatus Parcubacteria bacterium]|nr:2'-5' RNA ligase family protein [Candidatus Parcubacteria bacterium]
MTYNIALIFDKKIDKKIIDLYFEIKLGLDIIFDLNKLSIPHITVIKFESRAELNKKELANITKNIKSEYFVDFSGITILPSKNKGSWIEISILKNQELINLQNKLKKKLKQFKLISGIDDRFRPHITLAKTRNNKIKFNKLDYSILRKKQVSAKLAIGKADETFEFFK